MDEFGGGTVLDAIGLIERRFRVAGMPWSETLIAATEDGHQPADMAMYAGPVMSLEWTRGPIGAGELQFNGEPVMGGDFDADQLTLIFNCVPALWQLANDRAAMYRATEGPLVTLAHDTLARLTDGGGC